MFNPDTQLALLSIAKYEPCGIQLYGNRHTNQRCAFQNRNESGKVGGASRIINKTNRYIGTSSIKVNLSALVKISKSFGVSLDELVCDSIIKAKAVFKDELALTLNNCSEHEIRMIADMVKAFKPSIFRLHTFHMS